MPLWNGNVMYPAPILTVPYNHNAQSIAGPLSLTGYNIYNVGRLGVGTATPAYGVDVEGTGLDALINATGGYVVNGNGGSVGQCLASDGTAYDTPVNCLTSIGLLYYQTVDLNAVVQTQRPVANFSQRFSLTDSSSPARTNIDLDAPGTGNLVATETANPGSSTAFAQFDGNGNLTPSSGSFTTGSNGNGTWVKDPTGTITERGSVSMTNGSGTEATSTLTFPLTFPTGVQSLTVSPGNYANSSSNDAFMAYHVSLSTSGATLILRCAVNIGGSGCASISNTVPVYWIAIGN